MDKEQITVSVRQLMDKMTLSEKIGQLNQTGTTMSCTLPDMEADIDQWVTDMMEGRISKDELDRRLSMCEEDLKLDQVEAGRIGNFVNLYDDEKIAKIREAAKKSRLKIPLFFGVDVIRGYRTIFPTPLAMSCSWDMDVYRSMVRTAKREAKVCGVNWVFGPMLDIARDGRWGRIVESPGEDPYLASQVAKTMVRTWQTDEGEGRIMATAKHFLAYGAVSGGQDYNTVDMSLRHLYEFYLPPFKAAVDVGVGAVMSAFHDFDGIPCTCDPWLLTEVLRDQLGFDGFVVSDAEAVKQCVVHGVAKDEADAARLCLLAGGDMDMSSESYVNYLADLVKSGQVSGSDIDRAVERILTKKMEYGLFDEDWVYDPEKIKAVVLCDEHRAASREAAVKCGVLLKNNGVLPIGPQVKKILIVGELAADKEALHGPWAFTGDKEKTVTIVEGMSETAPQGVEVSYIPGFGVQDGKDGFEEALSAARQADLVIAVAGETAFMSGEAASRADLHLVGAQEDFLLKLADTGVPSVVVLVNGRPLAIGALQENDGIGAIFEAWHMGCETGNALADLLYGRKNPSGKLTVTFANEAGQEPMYYNHPNTGKPGGSFKFTSKYQDVPVKPLYPFGYGLSYTRFEYRDFSLDTKILPANGTVCGQVTVTNVGDRDGDEVVQLYVHDVTAGCVRPVKELKRFWKIHLWAGQSETIHFSFPAQELGYYDRNLKYVVEPGEFEIFAGPDSSRGLMETFTLI